MLQESYKMFEYKESNETNVWRWQELSITPVYVAREAQQCHVVKPTSSVYKKNGIWPNEEATDASSPERSFKFERAAISEKVHGTQEDATCYVPVSKILS